MSQMYDNKDSEVTVTEQGALTFYDLDTNTSTITAPADLNFEITVPEGKIWKLKCEETLKTSGSFVISRVRIYVEDDNNNTVKIHDENTLTGTNENFAPFDLTLSAGSVLHYTVRIDSVATDGDMTTRLFVQESNT